MILVIQEYYLKEILSYLHLILKSLKNLQKKEKYIWKILLILMVLKW